jgi:hypothetical protein
MDRSMKVMFGMMTVAICLLAITMMGNQIQLHMSYLHECGLMVLLKLT